MYFLVLFLLPRFKAGQSSALIAFDQVSSRVYVHLVPKSSAPHTTPFCAISLTDWHTLSICFTAGANLPPETRGGRNKHRNDGEGKQAKPQDGWREGGKKEGRGDRARERSGWEGEGRRMKRRKNLRTRPTCPCLGTRDRERIQPRPRT